MVKSTPLPPSTTGVLFHTEEVGDEDLTEDTAVEFDTESSAKGPRAANVVRQ